MSKSNQFSQVRSSWEQKLGQQSDANCSCSTGMALEPFQGHGSSTRTRQPDPESSGVWVTARHPLLAQLNCSSRGNSLSCFYRDVTCSGGKQQQLPPQYSSAGKTNPWASEAFSVSFPELGLWSDKVPGSGTAQALTSMSVSPNNK